MDSRPAKSTDQSVAGFQSVLAQNPTVRVEDYLAAADTKVAANLSELVSAEMGFRIQAGEAPDEAEYRARFPQLGDTVSILLDHATATFSSGGTDAPRPAEPSGQPTTTFGEYELQEIIGRGGMGVVYRARQKKLNRTVAVKTILAGRLARADQIERFHREAEAAARLDHPGIVPVFEIGEVDEVVFFSMGYVEGQSLADQLEQNTLTPRRAAEVVRQLANAVHYAHKTGVVHRDLKPSNVLLDAQGNPRITDFGLAKLIDQDGMTVTGAVVGTPSYMSPEQAGGQTDLIGPVSDVYGLGAILYACLCGHAPFRGPSTVATLRMVTTDRATPLRQLRSDIPRDLETICEKCLEKVQAGRYQSAQELASELERFLDGRPILARPMPAVVRLGHWCRRNPVTAGLLTTVAVSLIAGIAVSGYFAWLADKRATKAERGFAAATEQSELALKTLQTVIYTVQERMKEIPEARETRRELLVQVLGDLEKVSAGYVTQATVNRDSAKVLADLAQLYTQIGDDAGGDVIELMDKHYRRAVEIYLALVAETPDDESLLKDAFRIANLYGDTAREYRRFQDAIWAHRRGRQIAEGWHRRSPDNPSAQVAYLKSSEALGEALLRSGDKDSCREFILSAEKLSEAYAAKHPGINALSDLARCYCTVGDMYRDIGQYAEAEAAYERMCDTTKKQIALAPDDKMLLGDQSTDYERLGDLQLSMKNYEKAREYFEEAVRFSEMYMADDPNDLYRMQESTWGYSKLAQACAALKDSEREQWAREKLAALKARMKPGAQ